MSVQDLNVLFVAHSLIFWAIYTMKPWPDVYHTVILNESKEGRNIFLESCMILHRVIYTNNRARKCGLKFTKGGYIW